MKIHQLECFLAIARCKSFSLAAEEAFISQSTLSQQILKLEDELGVSLFVRHARSVVLTPAGESFMIHAKRIMAELELCKESMQEYASYKMGHLKIGIVPYMTYMGFGKIISSFLKTYQNIDIKLYTANTDELLKGLRERKTMISFVVSPYSDEYEVDFYPLQTEKLAMLVSSSHELAKCSVVDLCDVVREKFLLVNNDLQIRNSLLQACGHDLNVIHESCNADMIKNIVEENIGVALIGDHLAQKLSGPNAVVVPIKQKFEQQCGLAIPKLKRLPLTTRAFRDFILDMNAAPQA